MVISRLFGLVYIASHKNAIVDTIMFSCCGYTLKIRTLCVIFLVSNKHVYCFMTRLFC